MKRLVVISMVIMMLLVIPIFATASDDAPLVLSELSDEACLLFLEENGIEMPVLFEDDGAWLMFARTIIAKVEADPNSIIPYNTRELFLCAEKIKNAVNRYYEASRVMMYSTSSNANILIDNIVHGNWSDTYLYFNSYAYAIDYYVAYEDGGNSTSMWYDPGQIWWTLKGNPTNAYPFSRVMNVATIADLVEDDLIELGYTVNSVSTSMPNTNVNAHTKLICVRRDDDGIPLSTNRTVDTERWHDYHFMKLGADGKWYHKPTMTNPLQYKYTPTTSREWVFESATGSPYTYKRDESFTYESEIYFIEYTTPHEWEYVFWGSGQHILRCTICAEETLGNCRWAEPAYVGLNSHQYTCELCHGLGGNEACTLEYTNYVLMEMMGHAMACTVCEHEYGSWEACAKQVTSVENGTHISECETCEYAYVEQCNYELAYSGSGSVHTHADVCVYCDYEINTEICSFTYAFAGTVNGSNTHKGTCTVCGYEMPNASACTYKNSDNCMLCGVSKYVHSGLSVEEEDETA